MLLNLKSLNESLENKYRLEEAFDESMPKWLKDRLGYENLYHNKHDARKASDKYKGQPMTWYKRDRKTGENGGDLSLINQFLKSGVDISKVKVVEAPIPDKIPRITKNNQIIPIFLFDNGQVWAKGINDREEANWDRNDKNFSRTDSDELMKHVVKYAYIDLSDPNIDTVSEKRDIRKKIASELRSIPNYNRVPENKQTNYWNSPSYDKSGYVVVKSADKYAQKLRELRYNKLGDELEKAANNIETMKRQISDVFDDIELNDTDSLDLYRKVYSAIDYLKDAASCYKDACEYIDRMNGSEPNHRNSYADYALNYIERCNNCLSRIEQNYIGDLMKVSADW